MDRRLGKEESRELSQHTNYETCYRSTSIKVECISEMAITVRNVYHGGSSSIPIVSKSVACPVSVSPQTVCEQPGVGFTSFAHVSLLLAQT